MERALLELLEEHSNMGLASCDVKGNITLKTRALDRMLGSLTINSLDDAGQIGLFYDATGERRLGADEFPMARALQGEAVRDRVIAVRRPHGHTAYLRCNASPLRHSDGQIRGAMTFVQDVTIEWVATLKQNELRDQLVTTVNHELRTPLAKIIGHAELLMDALDDGGVPVSVTMSVKAVARASHDLAAMAARLTLLAELDDVTRIQPSPTDLVELLEVVLRSESGHALTREVRLQGLWPPHMKAIVDSGAIARGTRELVNNAIRHAPAGSTVTVELNTLDEDFEICVADEGPGIAESERARLVEPFERGLDRVEVSSSPGLGLAVAGAVAAAHGGSLALGDNEPCGLRARLRFRKSLV